MVERVKPEVWDILEEVIKEHPVMLNRAPTLHRLGIQAFEPVLVEGRALKLHPLLCTAYNADFDGDQMAIHEPLSAEAQAETRFLMLSANNLLKPQDGKPVTVPTQDMVLGSYYLTIVKPGDLGEGSVFGDKDQAFLAYQNHDISLQAEIYVRFTKEIDGKMVSKRIKTTMGKIIFNESIPQDLGFVDRSDPSKAFDLENYDEIYKTLHNMRCFFSIDQSKSLLSFLQTHIYEANFTKQQLANIHFEIALICILKRNYDEAIKNLYIVINQQNLDDTYKFALIFLSLTLCQQSKFTSALKYANKLLQMISDNTDSKFFALAYMLEYMNSEKLTNGMQIGK
jgi:DNA-directed RNA polymerase beta' subunit